MNHLSVVKVFRTLQGEGRYAGHPAVFLRLAGCNLWSGLPATRGHGQGACARWCDTEFHSGVAKLLDVDRVVREVASAFVAHDLIVVTGGEPLLQLNRCPELAERLAKLGAVHVETNGTLDMEPALKPHVRVVTVSPKLRPDGSLGDWKLRHADQVKVVWPGTVSGLGGWDLAKLDAVVEQWRSARHWYIQPQDPIRGELIGHSALVGGGEDLMEMHACWTEQVVKIAMTRSPWKLGVQLHKIAGLE